MSDCDELLKEIEVLKSQLAKANADLYLERSKFRTLKNDV